jgi:hypothetical protein
MMGLLVRLHRSFSIVPEGLQRAIVLDPYTPEAQRQPTDSA